MSRLTGAVRRAVHGVPRPRRVAERLTRWPPVGHVRWGDLRTVTPLGDADPAASVWWRYTAAYLQAHREALGGRVVEVAGTAPVSALLGASPPWREHSLLPLAALDGRGGDDAATPPAGTADCVVAAGTLAAVRDLPAAFARLRSLLAPGGALILTLPGIAPPPGPAGAGALRTFTTMSAERLATAAFGVPPVEVRAFGNPLSAVCMLHRLPADTLSAEELWLHHPDFPLLVGLVARTPA